MIVRNINIFEKYHFDTLQIFTPLPYHIGTPLFYIPIDNPNCLTYFLKVLAIRFLGITPEAKRYYMVEFLIVRIVMWICKYLPLTSIVKHILPGYFIMARKL